MQELLENNLFNNCTWITWVGNYVRDEQPSAKRSSRFRSEKEEFIFDFSQAAGRKWSLRKILREWWSELECGLRRKGPDVCGGVPGPSRGIGGNSLSRISFLPSLGGCSYLKDGYPEWRQALRALSCHHLNYRYRAGTVRLRFSIKYPIGVEMTIIMEGTDSTPRIKTKCKCQFREIKQKFWEKIF